MRQRKEREGECREGERGVRRGREDEGKQRGGDKDWGSRGADRADIARGSFGVGFGHLVGKGRPREDATGRWKGGIHSCLVARQGTDWLSEKGHTPQDLRPFASETGPSSPSGSIPIGAFCDKFSC